MRPPSFLSSSSSLTVATTNQLKTITFTSSTVQDADAVDASTHAVLYTIRTSQLEDTHGTCPTSTTIITDAAGEEVAMWTWTPAHGAGHESERLTVRGEAVGLPKPLLPNARVSFPILGPDRLWYIWKQRARTSSLKLKLVPFESRSHPTSTTSVRTAAKAHHAKSHGRPLSVDIFDSAGHAAGADMDILVTTFVVWIPTPDTPPARLSARFQ
ncbi:uncharacterized protein BXZ73DRAFT_81199 [Epithele typhae]|uniref:uncharacterized protein n=1 Tax=Epithele typhae TaxID=378194 RepID=UPI002007E3E5|nr:uncharacterized protein BXZ73DRAFT_81199 [Epithele typhae]KAH9915924.1 hypothetical protein BXZ73DRAFT_81199 [Epithele typhae]